MSKPERTFVEKITAIAGGIAALGGVLAAATQFSDQVKDLLGKLAELPSAAWWVIAGLLLSLGIFGLMHGLTRRSRLLRPEALLLKSYKAEHLKGREEDIDRLLRLGREYPLVHLVGESGAGKSALLQAGLCPELREDSAGLLPIYIEVWGQDWEVGPRSALTEAFWQALSEPDRQALNLNALDHPDHLFAALKRCQSSLRRIPLLIFDQFDDYQTRHRGRFLSSRQRTWLGAEKLVTANAFWREIKTLLDHDAIHCLFVTRSDTAAGLESVRFVASQVYALERLQEAVVQPLLTELTSSADESAPIIYAPERGWDKLKQRLASDLSQQGAVLPAQMKIAFQGLARLKTLTLGDYQRIGGLPGLEARHIEGYVAEAERHFSHTSHGAQLTQKQIRGLLLTLVNRETLKTVPRSNKELEQIILDDYAGEAKLMQQAVQACLDYLQQREILRKRIDPDTRRQLWLLDHDYLCAGVLEAERRANRWLALAEAGSRAFQEAGNHLLKRWRALLTPWQQMVLGVQRLLRRFRYGTLRAYAQWSLLRFVPYILILTLVSSGWHQWSAREHARKIFSEIGLNEDDPTLQEMDLFWELATSNNTARISLLEQALESPGSVSRFNQRVDLVVQASVGLDPDRREQVFNEILLPHLHERATDFTIRFACVKIGSALSIEKPEFSSIATQFIIESMEKTTNPFTSFVLANALVEVRGKLTPKQAERIFAQILLHMEKSSDPATLHILVEALVSISSAFEPEQAEKAFAQILTIMQRNTDLEVLPFLVEALTAISGKLIPEQSEKAIEQILAIMKKMNGPIALSTLTKALAAVPGTLTRYQAETAVTQILAVMERTSAPYAYRSLVEALTKVHDKLTLKQTERIFAQILTRIEKSSRPDELRFLAEALAMVPGELAPERAEKAFIHIFAVMRKSTGTIELRLLVEALTAVAGELAPKQAERGFNQMLPVIEKTTEPFVLRSLIKALATISEKLTPEQAEAAYTQILTRIEKRANPNVFRSLLEVLVSVLQKLGPEQAKMAFAQVLRVIESTIDPEALQALARALTAIPSKPSSEQVEKASAQIFKVMDKTTNSDTLRYLSAALTVVVGRLTLKKADTAYTQVLAQMKKTNDFDALHFLAKALATVPGDRNPQQLIDLMKWPTCIGEVRAPLLAKLEQQTGQKFEGNVWKMVEWAQANGYDVKSPPRRPGR